MESHSKRDLPDLTAGVPAASIAEGASLAGKAGKSDVLIVRTGGRLYAVGALCTHYRGALAEGLVVGDTVRCPLHHACFSLATGEALRAPALDPLKCWQVEERDGKVFVGDRAKAPPAPAATAASSLPARRRRGSPSRGWADRPARRRPRSPS